MSPAENPIRIEPCLLDAPPAQVVDLIAELGQAAVTLGNRLHPRSAQSLGELVALMNCYYSNLIEGHRTRPREIERALTNVFDADPVRRDLQVEARSHIRVQAGLQKAFVEGTLGDPSSPDFIRRLHSDFYEGASPSMLRLVRADGTVVEMTPGQFRNDPSHDNVVGFHHPPPSASVEAFMQHFHNRYRRDRLGSGMKMIALAAAHHRFNFIHPFPDGNGRVSRLMSHAMALDAGIGAHGLWSISRGLARGLTDRSDYMRMMNRADAPREGDTDGRGNLSQRALIEFVVWFLTVALDQVRFMQQLFDLEQLSERLQTYVSQQLGMTTESGRVVAEIFHRGSMPRGEATRQMANSERRGRELLSQLVDHGLLRSETPKGDVFLHFSSASCEFLFPQLFPVGE